MKGETMRLNPAELQFLINFYKGQEPQNELWDACRNGVVEACRAPKEDGHNWTYYPRPAHLRLPIIRQKLGAIARSVEYKLLRKLGFIDEKWIQELREELMKWHDGCGRVKGDPK